MCDKPHFIVSVGKKKTFECTSFDEAGDKLEAQGYVMTEGRSYGIRNYVVFPHSNPRRKPAVLRRKCL